MTSTRSPATGAPMSTPCSVQASGSQKAPCSGSRSAGSAAAFFAGNTANSAKPPSRWMPVATLRAQRFTRPRRQASQTPHQSFGSQATRAPSGSSTPAPRPTTIPQNSCPSVTGGAEGNSPL